MSDDQIADRGAPWAALDRIEAESQPWVDIDRIEAESQRLAAKGAPAQLQRALAEYAPSNVAAELDFDDPIDRIAALNHRMGFATPADAASMATGVYGQAALAKTWAAMDDPTRQLHRRRAAELLQFALLGRELRSRPEDNVA